MRSGAPDRRHTIFQGEFRTWLWVVLFGIAFAWVESAVVVYLREIYYEGGFSFPILIFWKDGQCLIDDIMKIEFARELATIIMLISIGAIAGRTFLHGFCYFIIAFGIWDIFYYIWLWVMIRWPDSLMTWDLLFLIPLPWVGPVITPVLIAAAMVAAGSTMLIYMEKTGALKWRWFDWMLEMCFAAIMIAAFCWDWKNIIRLPDGIARSGIPDAFAWWLFLPAYIIAVSYFIGRLLNLSKRKTVA